MPFLDLIPYAMIPIIIIVVIKLIIHLRQKGSKGGPTDEGWGYRVQQFEAIGFKVKFDKSNVRVYHCNECEFKTNDFHEPRSHWKEHHKK